MKSSIVIVLFSAIVALLGWGVGNAWQAQPYEVDDDNYGYEYSDLLNIELLNPLESPIFDTTIPTAVGSYTKGRLRNAIRIREEGMGYVKIFRNNNSSYSTHYLISTIEFVTSEMRDRYPNHPRLEITALSKQNGRNSPGHDSHQNGLDMDAIYLHKQGIERTVRRILNSSKPNGIEEFVQDGVVSRKVDIERNFQLMHLFVKTGRVNTIFTERHIKAALCNYAKVSRISGFENTLAKIKHWPDHKTHFHVRLECPNSSRQCKKEPPSNEGPGCSLERPDPIPRGGNRIG